MDIGSKVLIESLDICDYLDQQYPEPPLYPKDSKKREEDKNIIRNYDSLISLYYKAAWKTENKTLTQYLDEMSPYLQKLELELQSRGNYI